MTMSDSVGIDAKCFFSRDGLFKSILFIFSILVLILCSSTQFWIYSKPKTTELYVVAIAGTYSCATLLIFGFLYFFKLHNSSCCACLPWNIFELGNCALNAIIHLISMACSASAAIKWQKYRGNNYDLCVACAIFSMVSFIVYCAHGFIMLRFMTIQAYQKQPSGKFVDEQHNIDLT